MEFACSAFKKIVFLHLLLSPPVINIFNLPLVDSMDAESIQGAGCLAHCLKINRAKAFQQSVKDCYKKERWYPSGERWGPEIQLLQLSLIPCLVTKTEPSQLAALWVMWGADSKNPAEQTWSTCCTTEATQGMKQLHLQAPSCRQSVHVHRDKDVMESGRKDIFNLILVWGLA